MHIFRFETERKRERERERASEREGETTERKPNLDPKGPKS